MLFLHYAVSLARDIWRCKMSTVVTSLKLGRKIFTRCTKSQYAVRLVTDGKARRESAARKFPTAISI